MTNQPTQPMGRADLSLAVMLASREFTTAALMFHSVVAERLGLSLTDLKALDILQRCGPLTAGEMALQTRLATASVTSLLDRLERKRFVRRLRDPRDRRRVIVQLSPDLEQHFAAVFESFGRSTQTRIESYSEGELHIIHSFLSRGAREMREETAKLVEREAAPARPRGARSKPSTRPEGEIPMARVSVRYIVNDVPAAIAFYCQHFDFREEMHPAPTFAMLSLGELRLLLSAPSGAGGGGLAMPDGTVPQPGGWNRISLQVDDLAAVVERLRQAGVHFRNDIVTGVGGKQVLVDDPSGNPVELFQPTLPEARA